MELCKKIRPLEESRRSALSPTNFDSGGGTMRSPRAGRTVNLFVAPMLPGDCLDQSAVALLNLDR